MPLDLDLAILFGTVVGTALIARWSQLPITTLEILAGICLVTFFAFQLPAGVDSLLVLGSLLIVFLAGLETNFRFLRQHFRKAFTIGLGGFLVPFVGLFVLFYVLLHAPLLISLIGATALADTSISIVYTTLQQYELTDLPFGRLILAATLTVNLLEDFTVTAATVFTTPGFLFTLGVLAALLVAATLLPRLSKAVVEPGPTGFANVTTRALLFSLAVLATLPAVVGVPGILFVFVMGLLLSQFADNKFVSDIRKFAFALFVPLYFVAVGLRVDLPFVLANLGILGVIVGAASGLKILGLYPAARRFLGPERASPVSVLMNTRLTSATVILLLTLTLGLISAQWYSLLISSVLRLALGSALTLRLFPAFGSVAAARRLFSSPGPPETSVAGGGPEPGPTSLNTPRI